MNALFKHLTVRLWLTALLGGAGCLAILPWWQHFFGLHWLVLPAAVTLSVAFMIIGWVFNRMGINFVARHVNEASVWERAGMMREAESALQRGVAYFDSFWLSPLLRRQRTGWMMAILARFYIGQTVRNPHARTMVADYLCRNPHDDTVAVGWLEQLLNREQHLLEEYEAAARIGQAHGEHDRIQQLLMQFHLANGRSDFDAMQNYQQVWQHQQPLPREIERSLTRLLIGEGVLTHWALKVYLSGHQSGDQTAIDGITAAVRWLRPTVENRKDLASAQKLVAELATDRVDRLADRFRPVEHDTSMRHRANRQINRSTEQARELSRGVAASSKVWALATVAQAGILVKKLRAFGFARASAVSAGSALVIMVVFAVGWKIWGSKELPPPPPVEEAKPIIEPFTIQVAAYVKEADAQQFVDRLKQQGLDAFWTRATSAQRSWYQVKVSHFETKEQARQYGQDMKTKGIIDDFYVANYRITPPKSP